MVEAKIRNPALDLSKSRQQILDYFRSPPVKDKAQQEIIKIRVASELKSALYLFRPSDDYTQIAADFKDILDYPVDSDEKKRHGRTINLRRCDHPGATQISAQRVFTQGVNDSL